MKKNPHQQLAKKISGENLEAFTLIEVLIAASIFTIVSLIAVTVFVNVIRIQRRVTLENAIYEDSRVMMERIAREVRENTIDYEEYYNKALSSPPNPYGTGYGCYAQRFYNPGTFQLAGKKPSGDFNAYCNDDKTVASTNPGCIIDKNTLDINTGQNPYAGDVGGSNAANEANAFCDKVNSSDLSCGSSTDTNHNIQDQLYLINPEGTEETIFALKAIDSNQENALAMLRLDGQDNDHDGIVETWRDCTEMPANRFCCASGFDCSMNFATSNLESTLAYNSANPYQGFIPISPTRTDVISLKFLVAPLEDPLKAFAETTPDIQQQPHVTIIMTVQPSTSELSGYNGDTPTITLQTTVTSRVYNEVKSFYPGPTPSSPPGSIDNVCPSYN